MKLTKEALDARKQEIASSQSSRDWFNLGVRYYYSEDSLEADAIDCFSRVIDLEPNYSEAWAYLGNVYYDQKEYKKAICYFNVAVDLCPHDKNSWILRGHSCFNVERYEDAAISYRNAMGFYE